MAALRPKQKRFIDEYLIDLNAAAAYRRAGYKAATDHAAAASAHKLLTNADIAAEVESRRAALARGTELSQEWVLERLKAEAQERGEGSSHSARVRAAELIGKHLGMFGEQLNVTTASVAYVEFVVRRPPAGPDGGAAPDPV